MVTEGGIICFTTEAPEEDDYDGCRWEEVEFDFEIPEEMKNLGLFNGEPKAYIYVDTEGERLPGWRRRVARHFRHGRVLRGPGQLAVALPAATLASAPLITGNGKTDNCKLMGGW